VEALPVESTHEDGLFGAPAPDAHGLVQQDADLAPLPGILSICRHSDLPDDDRRVLDARARHARQQEQRKQKR